MSGNHEHHLNSSNDKDPYFMDVDSEDISNQDIATEHDRLLGWNLSAECASNHSDEWHGSPGSTQAAALFALYPGGQVAGTTTFDASPHAMLPVSAGFPLAGGGTMGAGAGGPRRGGVGRLEAAADAIGQVTAVESVITYSFLSILYSFSLCMRTRLSALRTHAAETRPSSGSPSRRRRPAAVLPVRGNDRAGR
jgi:hypothetical protein